MASRAYEQGAPSSSWAASAEGDAEMTGDVRLAANFPVGFSRVVRRLSRRCHGTVLRLRFMPSLVPAGTVIRADRIIKRASNNCPGVIPAQAGIQGNPQRGFRFSRERRINRDARNTRKTDG